jgi:hypothetical protein
MKYSKIFILPLQQNKKDVFKNHLALILYSIAFGNSGISIGSGVSIQSIRLFFKAAFSITYSRQKTACWRSLFYFINPEHKVEPKLSVSQGFCPYSGQHDLQ